MKYIAMPHDETGTVGVLTGEYQTNASARRYLSKQAQPVIKYNLYAVSENRWTFIGEISNETD